MDLYFNDLSIHGQFQELTSFRGSMETLIHMKNLAQRFGRELRCTQTLLQARAIGGELLPQVIGRLPRDERSALFQWITRTGPFWDESRHPADAYFECCGDVVTDSAIGEAAYRTGRGDDARLVSCAPSAWNYAPIGVAWHLDAGARTFELNNYWESQSLERALSQAPSPVKTWDDLVSLTASQFDSLTFANNWADPLSGSPFSGAAARKILQLLRILNDIKSMVNRSENEHVLDSLSTYFHGDRAWFSDSSTSEVNEFRDSLTFVHPDRPGDFLFCPWHGKISTGFLRLHFTWPARQAEPLYVVYAGPKLTKR